MILSIIAGPICKIFSLNFRIRIKSNNIFSSSKFSYHTTLFSGKDEIYISKATENVNIDDLHTFKLNFYKTSEQELIDLMKGITYL